MSKRSCLSRALDQTSDTQAQVVYELLRGFVEGGDYRSREVVAAHHLLSKMEEALRDAQPVQPRCIQTPNGGVVVPDEDDRD